MHYYYPIRHTVDMRVDDQIDVDADWQLCLEMITRYDLGVFARTVCLQVFGHADYESIVGADRLVFIGECQPALGQARALAGA